MRSEACVSSAGPQTGEGVIERESSYVSLQAQGELRATFLEITEIRFICVIKKIE